MKGHPSRPWLKLYNTKEWYSLRTRQLRKEPLCKFCKDLGTITAANIVDHIVPHKGDQELFRNAENLQSLCKTCHDSVKQRIEKSGEFGCDVNGMVGAWK